LIKRSNVLVFADFSGVGMQDLTRIKEELRKSDSVFKVFKKRLLKLALKKAGADFDPTQFEAQVGTVFARGDLSAVATPIYKFAKELAKANKNFKVLGAYDAVSKAAISVEEFTAVAKLPSREVLLAMVMGAITGPLRAFMYLINEISKKPAEAKVEAGS
jgi:large subunit ribosomal protein L10